MTKRIFRSIGLVAVAVFAASLILILGALYEYFSAGQMQRLATETALAAHAVETEGRSYLEGVKDTDCRLTWIAADGSVLFDNRADEAAMENHLEREEIRQALETGEGQSQRLSSTLMEQQLYCARRLSDGTVLRLSANQLSWWSLLVAMAQPICIVAVLAIVLSLLLASRLSHRIVAPLNELDLDYPDRTPPYEELRPLMARLSAQQNQLKSQEALLEHRKNEFETAVSHLSEGLILLGETGTVLSINPAAARILGVTRACEGKDLLLFCNTPDLRDLLHGAMAGRHTERVMTVRDRSYQINASPVFTNGKVSGLSLMIFDITEREKNEITRREFSANVSHELKTPLQSISGCAELLAGGMVEPQDVPRFAGRIYDESHRLMNLIEDIIRLSHLDEGSSDPFEKTDLFELASRTVQELTPQAEKAGVTLSLKGEQSPMNGVPRLLSGIVYNLVENAIKYNKPEGTVTVSVVPEGESVVLRVADTGVGIPPEDRDRIFERFYRVDKSRSKEVGGTGLGLSIVKHAAAIHRAGIRVESTPGVGSVFTVTFPREVQE